MSEGKAVSIEAARDAELAAALLAIDRSGLRGAMLRARASPVRDAWLSFLRSLFPDEMPCKKLPFGADHERIFGGLDLAATLSNGRPVYERGLLGDIGHGILVIPMAERIPAGLAARLSGVLDDGPGVSGDRFAGDRASKPITVAFDESCEDDDPPAASLVERLGLSIDLTSLRLTDCGFAFVTRDIIESAKERLPHIGFDDQIAASLVEVAEALGIKSLRPALFAIKAARASAALAGRDAVTEADAVAAIRIVLAPRAMIIPMSDPSEAESEAETGAGDRDRNNESAKTEDERDGELTERMIQSAKAAMPGNLLERLKLRSARTSKILPGRFGDERTNLLRGRRAGTARGKPGGAARLDLIATLRAAAPWQVLRRREQSTDVGRTAITGVLTRAGDFRLRRFKTGAQTVTIFAVDASGSSALERLSEAKGAVELILAECYIRRDQVAMVAFRGRGAEILLPPTRSLVRAKRSLAALAGGGGTPLAAGLNAAQSVAHSVRRRGGLPVIVILTDGKANVGRDGKGGRDQAHRDAMASAKLVRAAALQTILIDTSSRPNPSAAALAKEMQATYLPLPNANAAALSAAAMSVIR